MLSSHPGPLIQPARQAGTDRNQQSIVSHRSASLSLRGRVIVILYHQLIVRTSDLIILYNTE